MSAKRFCHGIKGLTNENSRINCKCRGGNYKKYPAHEVPRVAKKIRIKGPKGAHPSKVVPGPAALAPNALGRMYL